MDIVERLRQEIGGYTDKDIEKAEANMQEAADEIERLRKENEFLKEENFSLMFKISRQKSPEVKAKIIAKSLGIETTGGE